jgi:hypothetical protein
MLLCAALIPRYGIAVALLLFFSMAPCLAFELRVRRPRSPPPAVVALEGFANRPTDLTRSADDDDAASADSTGSNDGDAGDKTQRSAQETFLNLTTAFPNLTERREQFKSKVGRINDEIRGLERFYKTLSNRPKDAKQHYNFINH